MSVKESTARKLFAVSRNQCAFQDCLESIYDTEYDSIVGQIAHIRAKKEGGPRFEPDYDKVNEIENLILLCNKHHKIVDDNTDRFTTDTLLEMKKQHESAGTPIEEPEEDIAKRLLEESGIRVEIKNSTVGSVINVQSTNQQGGITAGIVNQGTPRRRLSASQKSTLHSKLESMNTVEVKVASVMDGEAISFAKSMSTILKEAKWTVEESYGNTMWFPTPKDVEIVTSDKTERDFSPQLMALAQALVKSNIPVRVSLKQKVSKPEIIIGVNIRE